MWTIVAMVAIAVCAWLAQAQSRRDSRDPDSLLQHSRQDIRLALYLLAAVLIGLGVVADRLP